MVNNVKVGIKEFNLEKVESILKNRISKNPNRFEEANGIVFTVKEMDFETDEYFSTRGIEFYELKDKVFYTETVMSVGEFGNLERVVDYKKVA